MHYALNGVVSCGDDAVVNAQVPSDGGAHPRRVEDLALGRAGLTTSVVSISSTTTMS